MTDDGEADEERPSRSARKRAAESAQELGERLVALSEADLACLELPERLLDAVREARRISSRAAGARQRRYIGKLMRGIDCQPILAALAALSERRARDAQRFARAESWRDRLLADGDAALEELIGLYPSVDRRAWRARLARARSRADTSQAAAGTRAAQRELFRALRELLG